MTKILYLHAGAELYGADIVLLELLKNLDRTVYTPLVVLPEDGPLVEKMRQCGIAVRVVEYPILRRKYFNAMGLFQYIRHYLKYARLLKKICKEEKINVIHINTSAVLLGCYIRKKLKIPLVWHIHEIIVRPKFVYRLLSYIVARYADSVITVSNAVKVHLEKSGYFKRHDIKIIYNGVDNNVFKPENDIGYLREEFKIKDDMIIVGMIGRVNAWKGQNDFLEAIEPILEKYPNVCAMLVGGVFQGEEWRFKELQDKVNTMKHKERVYVLDYRKDTPNIHALYDVFVLPSTSPDPLPTVVLEAMASGKPIVGYCHGGICEMVEEDYNGSLATICEHKALSEQIEKLVKNTELRIKMGQNSLKRQKKLFSIHNYSKSFMRVYSDMLCN